MFDLMKREKINAISPSNGFNWIQSDMMTIISFGASIFYISFVAYVSQFDIQSAEAVAKMAG